MYPANRRIPGTFEPTAPSRNPGLRASWIFFKAQHIPCTVYDSLWVLDMGWLSSRNVFQPRGEQDLVAHAWQEEWHCIILLQGLRTAEEAWCDDEDDDMSPRDHKICFREEGRLVWCRSRDIKHCPSHVDLGSRDCIPENVEAHLFGVALFVARFCASGSAVPLHAWRCVLAECRSLVNVQ